MNSMGETRKGAEGAGKNSQAKGPLTDHALENAQRATEGEA